MVGDGGHQCDRKEIYSQSNYQIHNFPYHASALLCPSLGNTLQRKAETVTLKEEVLNVAKEEGKRKMTGPMSRLASDGFR